MAYALPAAVIGINAAGAFIIAVKESWEFRRMFKTVDNRNQAVRLAEPTLSDLIKLYRDGMIEEDQYEDLYQKYLVAKVQNDLVLMRSVRATIKVKRFGAPFSEKRQGIMRDRLVRSQSDSGSVRSSDRGSIRSLPVSPAPQWNALPAPPLTVRQQAQLEQARQGLAGTAASYSPARPRRREAAAATARRSPAYSSPAGITFSSLPTPRRVLDSRPSYSARQQQQQQEAARPARQQQQYYTAVPITSYSMPTSPVPSSPALSELSIGSTTSLDRVRNRPQSARRTSQRPMLPPSTAATARHREGRTFSRHSVAAAAAAATAAAAAQEAAAQGFFVQPAASKANSPAAVPAARMPSVRISAPRDEDGARTTPSSPVKQLEAAMAGVRVSEDSRAKSSPKKADKKGKSGDPDEGYASEHSDEDDGLMSRLQDK